MPLTLLLEGLQPRTLEILQALRLKEPLEERGSRVRETASWTEQDGRLSQASIEPWTDVTALFPYDLVLSRGDLEACFENHLSSHGVVIDRSLELVHLQYRSDHDPPFVIAYIKNHVSGCIETWHARFVIGADGVNSSVRRLSGISLFGPESKLNWLVATVDALTDFPDHRRRAYIWSQSRCLIMTPSSHGTYHLRILLSARDILTLNEHTLGVANTSTSSSIIASKAMINFLENCVKCMLIPYQFAIRRILFIDQNSTFKQIASRFCNNDHCTFLLGESSHTHSLWADHHVNSDIADAYSLSWKLATACKGRATRSILSTHNAEQYSLALNLGRKLEANFTLEKGDHFECQEKQTLIAAHHRQYVSEVPNVLIREEVRNMIKGNIIAPGKVITLPSVLRHSSGDEVLLLNELPCSGFHLFIFAGRLHSQPILRSLCSYLSKTSALWSLEASRTTQGGTNEATEYSGVLAEVYLIHSSPHLEISLANLPFPFTGSDRVFEDVNGKVHESIGISQNLGALVLVRPDLVISIITNLDDAPGIAKFLSALAEG